MDDVKNVERWKEEVMPALLSKKDELHMLGYADATTDSIWECLKANEWKNKENKRIHEIVQDILHLKTHTYMNYLTVNVLQSDSDLADAIASVSQDLLEDDTNDES